MIVLPFLLIELEIEHMVNQGDSWMKIMSKSLLISNNISVRTLFLQTFWENTCMFFKIMLAGHSQLSKLICSYSHKAPDISYCTSPC